MAHMLTELVIVAVKELVMKTEKFAYFFGVVFVAGIFLFFSLVQSHSEPSPAAAHAGNKKNSNSITAGKKLVFSDEFNGNALDNINWSTCYDWRRPAETGCTNSGNFEQEWYTNDQIQVENGSLLITAKKSAVDVAVQNQIKTFAYQSGMVSSGRGNTDSPIRWAGTYGYYEARMKFQKGQGIWPAFWLLPANKEWPPEIDIMEFTGDKPGEILQTLHWQGAGVPQKSEAVIKGDKDYSDGWHTYGVDWEPNRIDWYIDGKKTRSYTGPDIPNTPMEIILNLAVGGLLPGNATKATPFPSELQVDYVHVYQTADQAKPHQY